MIRLNLLLRKYPNSSCLLSNNAPLNIVNRGTPIWIKEERNMYTIRFVLKIDEDIIVASKAPIECIQITNIIAMQRIKSKE